jgi:hypothetical protein
MYADILRGIVGVEVFPIVSLVLFVGVFGGVLVWALRADRKHLDACAALPLEEPDRTLLAERQGRTL